MSQLSIHLLQGQMNNFYSYGKKVSKNISGLVTSYEANMKFQVTNRDNKTDKSTRDYTENTFRTQQMKDFDEYQDLFNREGDDVFINVQQQKKIHQLLQFARKGKINPGNAFEIPVRVLDPEFVSSINNRFWKFASELLNASICIYDKRVENMYQTTNYVFGHLLRTKNSEQVDQSSEETYYQKSRKKKAELMRIQIGQLGASENIQIMQVASFNLEDANKLNIRNQSIQFYKDPLFQQTMKSFDSNALTNLFLNTLEQDKQLKISFFCDYEYQTVQQKQVQIQKRQENHIIQWPACIEDQLNKLNFISRNNKIYQKISVYLKGNIQHFKQKSGLLNFQLNFKDQKFNQQDQSIRNETTQLSLTSNQSFQDKFSFNFVSSSHLDIQLQQNDQTNRFPIQQNASRQSLFIEENQYSIILPREIQFKGSKLQRNKIRQPRKRKEIIKQQYSFQQFSVDVQYNRDDILKIKQQSKQLRIQNKSNIDKFLFPKSMDVFIQIYRRRRKQQKYRFLKSIQGKSEKNDEQLLKSFCNKPQIGENTTILQMAQSINQMSHGSQQTILKIYSEQISTEGLNNINRYGLRNIRQIKQTLYNRLQIKKQLRLSQLLLPISFHSTFLIFLHLANEHQFAINSIEDESDIMLQYRQQQSA